MTDGTFDLGLFRYNAEYKSLSAQCSDLGVNGFPSSVCIRRSKDGKLVTFYPDNEAFIANEGWDGEMKLYRPMEGCSGIKCLSLTPY